MVAGVHLRWRDVERGILIEKASRDEGESGVLDRHDRPVFRPREMSDTNGVPEHDVRSDERAVGLYPGGQTLATHMLVRILTRSVPLCPYAADGALSRAWLLIW